MTRINELLERIDAEVHLQQERQRLLREKRLVAFERRQSRYRGLYLPVKLRLEKIWIPHLEALTQKLHALAAGFGESVRPTTTIRPSEAEPHSRETLFTFEGCVAKICLKFAFYHDVDLSRLVLDFKLEIIPVFLKFENESRLVLDIESFDEEAAASWLDDRIVNFARTYLAMHENSSYVADQMVEDPIAKVRFPKFAAATTAQRNGATFYFIGQQTKREFERVMAT